MKDKVRDAALRFLCDAERDGKYINLALPSGLAQFTDPRDRALFTLLVYGVTERAITLDYYIERFSSRPLGELERFTKYILRLGFYQLLYLNTPSHAAVNETVSLARQTGERGFVNAVLRAYLRAPEVALPEKKDGVIPYLSVRYSFPEWICRSFVEDYGEEKAEKLLAALCCRAPLTLRVNTLRTTREALLARLAEYSPEKTPFSPNGILLRGDLVPSSLPGFDSGDYLIQDEASQLAAELLGAVPGSTACDVCAAPGSKSLAVAMGMANEGKLWAFDLHRSKLPLIEEGARRFGCTIIEAAVQNALQPRAKLRGKVDFLLCDTPCSGLGVAAKKPDVRRKGEKEVKELPELSYAILDASAAYLRAGGRMVFSTCTLRRAENEEVAERFLREHPDFQPEDFVFRAEDGRELRSENGMLTLLPHITGTDGFFLSRFRRKGE